MLLWWAACTHDWCAPGTIETDRTCLPVTQPEPWPVWTGPTCGPGTVEQDGECVIEEPVVDCGPGTIKRGDLCVDLDLQFVRMPFPAGQSVRVSQGNHGRFSHGGSSSYAVDWVVPEGTTIVAARAGRVLDVREDSDEGCGDASCSNMANFITIDHGDGTVAQYWHLQKDGALVRRGQIVGRGQIIGLSGNTGFSTGPHLHFQVRDPMNQSLPLFFEDQPDGVVYAGATFVSGNTPEPPPVEVAWSTCPPDLFAFLGVRLEPGVPCTRVEGSVLGPVGVVVQIEGAQGMISTWSSVLEQWQDQCSPGPAFQGEVVLDPELYALPLKFAVSAAKEDCTAFQAWDKSVHLLLVHEEDAPEQDDPQQGEL